MAADKKCFFNQDRPCDLTCKAAFEVDDPVDNVDCYFIWMAYHFGEGLFEMKRMFEGFSGMSSEGPGGSHPFPGFPGFPGSPGGGPGGAGPKKPPKGFPTN
jgi:hypothetical protein